MKLHTIISLLLLVYLVTGFREFHQEKFRNTKNGELTEKVVFTTTRQDNPAVWFNREHPQFEYTGQISWVSQERGYIRVRKTVDAELNNTWHLNAEVLPSMNVTEVWDAGYHGSGIVVGVLDDGLQTDHPDLEVNCDTENDKDIYGFDDDPYPPAGSSHGTEVAGFIAGVRGNNLCTVGIAYNSTLVGIRILGDYAITDSEESQALSHKLDYIDIYSNSWGPDDGFGFFEPGPITTLTLEKGGTLGRDGKGAIYIWASGNGGLPDNCNGDRYTSSIYTIAITSVAIGQNAWYSEVCSGALAAAYGGSEDDRYLRTTTTYSACKSDGIQGTSYAAPIASAIVALTLEANPNLTWRDIQHLIVLTSSLEGFHDTYSNITINGAHKKYSQVLGFGLMNAKAMVEQALTWTSVLDQQNCTTSNSTPSVSSSGAERGNDTITVNNEDCSEVTYLEHVTIEIEFTYTQLRGATELYLTSPSGSRSHLLHYRYNDAINNPTQGYLTWTFMSVHFWRESPVGKWTLEIGSYSGLSVVTLVSWSLTFYGTATDPLPHINQCSNSPCQSNENCVNLVYTYRCCPGLYTGENCDIKLPALTTDSSTSIPAKTSSASTVATTDSSTSTPAETSSASTVATTDSSTSTPAETSSASTVATTDSSTSTPAETSSASTVATTDSSTSTPAETSSASTVATTDSSTSTPAETSSASTVATTDSSTSTMAETSSTSTVATTDSSTSTPAETSSASTVATTDSSTSTMAETSSTSTVATTESATSIHAGTSFTSTLSSTDSPTSALADTISTNIVATTDSSPVTLRTVSTTDLPTSTIAERGSSSTMAATDALSSASTKTGSPSTIGTTESLTSEGVYSSYSSPVATTESSTAAQADTSSSNTVSTTSRYRSAVRLTDVTYTPELDNRESNEFKTLAEIIKEILLNLFIFIFGIQRIFIIGFRQGSVLVDFELTSQGYYNESVLQETIETPVKSGSLGNYTVDSTGFTFVALDETTSESTMAEQTTAMTDDTTSTTAETLTTTDNVMTTSGLVQTNPSTKINIPLTTRGASGGISESTKDVIFISVSVAAVIITIQVVLYLRFMKTKPSSKRTTKGSLKSKDRDGTLRRDSDPKIYSRDYAVPSYPYSGKHIKPVFTSSASNKFSYYNGHNWYDI